MSALINEIQDEIQKEVNKALECHVGEPLTQKVREEMAVKAKAILEDISNRHGGIYVAVEIDPKGEAVITFKEKTQ